MHGFEARQRRRLDPPQHRPQPLGRTHLRQRNPTDGHGQDTPGTHRPDAGRPAISRSGSASQHGLTCTLGRYLTHWIDNVVPDTVSAATEAQYRDVLRLYVIPRLGTKRLATLSPSDVDAMLRDMASRPRSVPDGYSPTSRRLARSILRLALRRAEADGLIARNAAALSNSVRQDRTEGRSLTPDQARRLLAAASGDRLEAGIVVALTCGLRLSELLGLTWDAIDLESTPPRADRSTQPQTSPWPRPRALRRPKRIGAAASSISPKQACDALRAHRARQAAESPSRRSVGSPTTRRRPRLPEPKWCGGRSRRTVGRLADCVDTAGLGHWTPHELRHSAASLLLASGVPLVQVADFLGHSSATVTASVYAHVLEDARTSIAAAMSVVLTSG